MNRMFSMAMILRMFYLLNLYSCINSFLVPFSFPHFIKVKPSSITNNYQLPALYLDTEDILEEKDLDLLMQVRKQMFGSKATSKDITNRIKEFYSSPISAESKALFSSYILQNNASLDIVNAIMIVEGSSKIKFDFLQIITWPRILEAMKRPCYLLTSSIIYRGISCLKALEMGDTNAHEFQKLLWEHIKGSSIVLNANDVCPAIYSLQSVNCQSLYGREIIKYLTYCLSKCASIPIPAKHMCSAIYGMRKQKPITEIRLLLWEIANRIEETETYYHSVNICIAMNGLQGMDDCYPEVRRLLAVLLAKAIDASEQGIDKAGDREISMALFGLQKMGSNPILKTYCRSSSGGMYNNDHLTAAVHSVISKGGSSFGIEKDLLNLAKYTRTSTSSYNMEQQQQQDNVNNNRNKITPELQSALKYISSLLDHFEKPFEAKRLGFAMMGLSRLNGNIPETREIIQKLSLKAKEAWGDISGQEISMILHGLIKLQSGSVEVRSLVSRIVPLVKRCPYMTSADARSALIGLQGMYADSGKEITSLFTAVADLLERSNIKFTSPLEISSSLYGIQGISADSIYGKKLLSQLSNMMSSVTNSSLSSSSSSPSIYNTPRNKTWYQPDQLFKGRDIAMSLYGLRNSNGATKEALDILSKLTQLIISVKQDLKQSSLLSANDVATCLYGLQSFNSNQNEVIALLKVLNPYIHNAQGKFNAKGLSMALNGLQGFDGKQLEVRELIQGLNKIITRTIAETATTSSSNSVTTKYTVRGSFYGFDDFHQVSAALYGLANLNSKYKEVLELVDNFAKIISISNINNNINNDNIQTTDDTKIAFNVSFIPSNNSRKKIVDIPRADKVAMALYGIQHFSPHTTSMNIILEYLEEYVAAMTWPNGVAIGMAFQCFRHCKGKPTTVQRRMLALLSDKLVGYSTKKLKIPLYTVSNNSNRINSRANHNEHYATIRSVLGGISGLDFTDDSIIQIIRIISKELLNPERVNIVREQYYIDISTLQLLVNTYEKVITLNKLHQSQELDIFNVANIVNKFMKSSKTPYKKVKLNHV